jgi:winged helix DNA-binding protein
MRARPRTPSVRVSCALACNYVAAKQGVGSLYKGDCLRCAARSAVGIHAARLSTPFVSFWARTRDLKVQDVLLSMVEDRSLIKLRCMRTTLHVVPLDVAPVVHRATLKIRTREVERKLSILLGPDRRRWNSFKDLVSASLEHGPLKYTELIQRLTAKMYRSRSNTDLARVLVKLAWEEGVLSYLNKADRWGREDRWFDLTERMYPSLDLDSCSERQAVLLLVEYYIRAYGPVLFEDLAWWSGISRNSLKEGIAELDLSDKLCRVQMEGWSEEFLMLRDDVHDLATFEYPEDWISFLGYEDPLLKAYAYAGSRERYVERRDYNKLFNSIGEARASIVRNGRVVGLWRWSSEQRMVVVTLWRKLDKSTQKAIRRESEELTEYLLEHS